MSKPDPLLSGAAGRCPNCGEGHLFEGFLKVSPLCEACGFDLAAADSGDGPAVFVILIAGLIVAFGALFTMVAWRTPVWLTLLIWLPMTFVIVLVLLRPMKGLMLAAQFKNKASQARHD
ncbi:DUF983 domain-containing protein [Phenylobacterium sp.]|uniref:DUF983 domain-containing protein n=1 Tax=Phenylobacterium sp. TaxID=1871053 RepID=UPI001202B4D9|nr:DUF983 domain-containing protein [Phenylobacterium sp.]THD58816.1 MAG: DUF983 domain-containing protein [Phenylobacterium sp.]